MDQDRFSNLTRAVGQARTRRAALGAFVAATFGAAIPGLARAEADTGTEGKIIPGCRLPGQRCRKKDNCCTGKCKNNRCACVNKGGSCLVEFAAGLPPLHVHANCCSNRCSKSTGQCR
jgi:hypothetical protein